MMCTEAWMGTLEACEQLGVTLCCLYRLAGRGRCRRGLGRSGGALGVGIFGVAQHLVRAPIPLPPRK